MAINGSTRLEMTNIATNVWKWLEMAGNSLKFVDLVTHGLNELEMAKLLALAFLFVFQNFRIYVSTP